MAELNTLNTPNTDCDTVEKAANNLKMLVGMALIACPLTDEQFKCAQESIDLLCRRIETAHAAGRLEAFEEAVQLIRSTREETQEQT